MHTFRALQGQKSRLPTSLFLRIRVPHMWGRGRPHDSRPGGRRYIPDLTNSFLTLQIQAVTALDPGVESDELVGGLVAGDELGGGGYGGGAIGVGVGVAAIVKDDVGGLAAVVEAVDFDL